MELERKRKEVLEKSVRDPRSELYVDGLLVSLGLVAFTTSSLYLRTHIYV
jgi:hypothetical protein